MTMTTFCAMCEKPVEHHGSWTEGHNGQPLVDGRVCDGCNQQVIAARFFNAMFRRDDQ